MNDIGMEDLPSQLLSVIDSNGTFDSNEMAAFLKVDHQKVVGAVKSLENQEGVIIIVISLLCAYTLLSAPL